MAAAGNDYRDNDATPTYPASYDCANIIAVAGSDHDDNCSWFSNWGLASVHLAAPGSSILSTVPGDTYGTMSGTSMAAPHVAGAAALLLSMQPDAPYTDVKSWLLDSVTPLPQWEDRVVAGGRLNAAAALRRGFLHFALPNAPALPATIPPNGSLTFDVLYAPRAEGAHAGVVRIGSNDTNTPVVEVALSGEASLPILITDLLWGGSSIEIFANGLDPLWDPLEPLVYFRTNLTAGADWAPVPDQQIDEDGTGGYVIRFDTSPENSHCFYSIRPEP